MKETAMQRPGAFGLGTSVIIHAAAILTFLLIAGHAGGIHKKVVTVVLDGQQLAIGSGNGGGSPPARHEAVKETRRSLPARSARSSSRLPSPPTRPLHETDAEKKVERVEATTDGFSEVVSDTPAFAAARTDGGSGGGGREGPKTGGAGGSGAGTGTGHGSGSSGEAGRAAYLKEHFAFIRELILKHLTYPTVARRMGWKGRLTVSFVICEGGGVENVRIVRSSGHKILDENALSTVRKIQPFPKPPVRAEIVIPIEYRLG
jgi:protein TonB